MPQVELADFIGCEDDSCSQPANFMFRVPGMITTRQNQTRADTRLLNASEQGDLILPTPLPNLFFVGASTQPGTGLPMVMLSPKLTCERIEQWVTRSAPKLSPASSVEQVA